MSATPASSNLLSVVSASLSTIEDVISIMQNIDSLLPSGDGLKWFNLLYLNVTEEVLKNPPQSGWNDPQWLGRLDVIFAGLYFSAITNSLTGQPIPKSWQALFEVRQRSGIDRIQFALAGMNAHINHDLALALLAIQNELHQGFGKNTPEHQDYEEVNNLLEAVLPNALTFLAAGLLGEIAQDTGKIGQLLAIWNVRAARDLAWDFGEHLLSLPPLPRQFALDAQDQFTGVLGRGLLIPM
jgi:hypothetical protein